MKVTDKMLDMKHILKLIIIIPAVLSFLASCKEVYVTYSDAEYVMFADTAAFYPVQEDVEYFKIPVVSTVKCNYDRTFAVEILDKGSNAIENVHYTLASNTVTIKAGETRSDVLVHGIYDSFEAEDSLGFTLSLVMPDQLEMPLYGRQTKATLVKCCPFDINDFTGWCMFTSMFLYEYSVTGSYQRLIKTKIDPNAQNTIICENWLKDGYDLRICFNTEDPMKPLVSVEAGQIVSDEGSFFGIIHGDDRIRVRTSPYYDSLFYPCGSYLTIATEMYVENIGTPVGTVGHYYNIMEWVSDEEAARLKREEGM